MSTTQSNPEAVTAAVDVNPAAARKAGLALYAIVLTSGGVMMGVEIAGAKILAPGFGTSTFVWGSIIGLFMGAMAAGYYIGGKLADRDPSFVVLTAIVAGAGAWTLLVPRFGPAIANQIALMDLGQKVGPLLASTALFFVPSFLMAMVSVYAVKLSASSLAGLGGVAGRLYAWSTFGSILGTLLTTFVLIPNFSLSATLQGLGIVLISVAMIGLVVSRVAAGASPRGSGVGVMALLILVGLELWVVFPIEPPLANGNRMLMFTDSSYHEILVTEEVMWSHDDDDGATIYCPKVWNPEASHVRRWMKFNENIESGIYPFYGKHKNAVSYTDLLHLPLIWTGKPKKILVVGGGGGIIPTQYYNWYGCEVDVAEIDYKVEDTARAWFQMPDESKLPPAERKIKFFIEDGRQMVRHQKDGEYDIIMLDAYSSGGQIPFHLMTWQFMKEVKAKLRPGGILVTNIISGLKNANPQIHRPADLYLAEFKTLSATRAEALRISSSDPADNVKLFQQLYVFPKVYKTREMSGDAAREEYRNIIVIATDEKEPRSRTEIELEAARISSEDGTKMVKCDLVWHAQRVEKGPTTPELESVPIFEDGYAPVDTMYRPVKRDENSRNLW